MQVRRLSVPCLRRHARHKTTITEPDFLESDAWPVWLAEATGDPPGLLHAAAEGVVKLWPVSRAVSSVRNNGAALLDPIDDPASHRQAMRRRATIRRDT
jgi:hypothetical protein